MLPSYSSVLNHNVFSSLPKSVRHFHGTEVTNANSVLPVYKGTAFDFVDQAWISILSQIDLAVDEQADKHCGLEMPPEVVREAIVNALPIVITPAAAAFR